MSIARTRKNKENPHYGFLVSWEPKDIKKEAVKGESKSVNFASSASIRHGKNADSLAQAESAKASKKAIIRSLLLISLVLILELVVYLAWNKFIAK